MIDGSNEDRMKSVHKVEIIISNLLRTGVVTSLAVIVIGTVVSFIRHPDYLTSHTELNRLTTPGAAFPSSIPELVNGLKSFQGRSMVLLGLLILIATPVLRVAVSIVAFIYQKDRVFVLITTVVLVLLLLSFVLGKAGG